MPERCCGQREACSVCGSDQWRDGHFTGGRLICAACWREIASQKGNKVPPAQQTLNLAQAAKPQPTPVRIPEPERWGDG